MTAPFYIIQKCLSHKSELKVKPSLALVLGERFDSSDYLRDASAVELRSFSI